MAFDPQDYDVKPIGDAGLTERTSLDGSERILVQAGPDENVDTTPMEFVKYSTIQAKIDTLKGTGWEGETVKGNADAIAEKENLANKKSTLAENSETYYPNQKAVNDGLATKASATHNHDDRYYTESEILNKTYPVGAVYLSVVTTSPASLFGGTWTQIGAGYALWTATSGATETIAAGLPNITGNTGNVLFDDGAGEYQNGALYRTTGTRTRSWSGTSGDAMRTLYFDASRSSSIYGASSSVQPPAYKVYAWRRTA
jgi:hypothetical protein